MLKYIRIILVTLFCLALLAAVGLYYYELTHTDSEPPVFQSDSELLEISVKDPKSAMLAGLRATDNVDGDLTDKIRVKHVSTLYNGSDVEVEYIVFDEASNHATYSRSVRYTDYVSPRFKLTQPMIFSAGETVNFRDSIVVTDLRDGNISNRLTLRETTVVNTIPGVYTALLSVTNQMGDTVDLPLTIQITDNSVSRARIDLSQYLIYLPQGTTRHSFRQYLQRVTDPLAEKDREIPLSAVTVNDADVDFSTPGVYEVYYYYTGLSGELSNVILTVIVE